MNERFLRSLILLASLLLMIFSCAKIVPPSGGPVDITPPVMIKSVPLNGAVMYKGKNIILTFDEYVVLDKINEKFMISPPVNKKPRIILKGKSLYIEFQEEFKDSTTYTLYFQDAIRDLNNNNPIYNFQFVFSTGKFIDSLSVTGNVFNSMNLEVPASTLVMMYKNPADSAPRKSLPDYLTLADNDGEFRINNTREGKYKLYSLQDKNDNKKYDLIEEGFAFYDSIINLNTIKNYLPVVKDTSKTKQVVNNPPVPEVINGEYKLYLFVGKKKDYYLTSSARDLPYKLVYSLSRPPDTAKFEFGIPDVNKKAWFIEKNSSGDTMKIWLTDSAIYSRPIIKTLVKYPLTDSTGTIRYKRDTIPLRWTPKPKETRTKFKYTTNIVTSQMKPGQQIIIISQTPLKPPDTSRIRLYETVASGKTSVKTLVPYQFIKDSTNSCRYLMKTKLKDGGTYLFIANSASFGNIYGSVADSTGIKFTVLTSESLGRLTMNISNGEGNLIVQLLDSKENLVAERFLKKEGKADFPFLDRGSYRVRVIYDLNGDGKWTTGDFDLKRQPEPVSYYPDQIEIKINWIEEYDWNVSQKNVKDQKLREKKGTKK